MYNCNCSYVVKGRARDKKTQTEKKAGKGDHPDPTDKKSPIAIPKKVGKTEKNLAFRLINLSVDNNG